LVDKVNIDLTDVLILMILDEIFKLVYNLKKKQHPCIIFSWQFFLNFSSISITLKNTKKSNFKS